MVNIVLSILGRDQSSEAMRSAGSAVDALSARRDSASRRLAASSARDADAAGRVRIAQLQLTEAQTRYGEESLQAQRASERLASAQRAAVISANNAEDAAARLAAAEQRLAEEATRSGNSVSESADHTKSSFGSMVGGIVSGGALAAGAFAIWQTGVQALDAVAGAVENAAKSSIDFNSQLENADIGFTTMLGSGKKSEAFLKDLQTFAASTPFEFGNLVSNAQSLLGMGVSAKKVIPDLTALGDSVASIGGSAENVNSVVLAFGQLTSKTTIDMGNLQQIAQNGVPSALKILANSYHVTTGQMSDMISSGKVLSADALPRLVKGIEKGTSSTAALGGMMQKQSQTFSGAVSNIQDGLQQAGGKAFKPFFTLAEQGAKTIAGMLSSKQFSQWVGDTSKTLGAFVKDIGGALTQVFGDPKVTSAGKNLFADVQKGIKGVGPAMKTILPDLVSFGKQVLPAIISAADKVAKHIPDAIQVFKDLAKYIKDIAPIVADVIDIFGDWMSAAMKISSALDKGIISMLDKLTGFQKSVAGVFKNASSWLTHAGGDIIAGLINGITGAAGGAISAIANVGENLVSTFAHAIDSHSPSKKFHQLGLWITQGLGDGIAAGSESDVSSAMDTLIGKVQSGYDDLADESTKAAAKKKADQAKISKDTTRAKDLNRSKDAAEDDLHAAKTAKQRKAAQDRITKLDEQISANRKDKRSTKLDLKSTEAEIKADGTAAERSKREAAILKQIGAVNTQLDSLATARDNVAANLKTAQGNLDEAIKTRSDFAANVQSSVRALGALTGATASNGGVASWDGSTSAGTVSWQDEVTHLQTAVSTASKAQSTFAALKNLGLNTQSYSELESAFQSNGDLTAAASLLQGGAGAVGQVNDLENQLGNIGSSFGSDTSSTLYDAGVNAAQGIVDGLQGAEDQLTDQMTKLGTKLAAAVKTELAAPFTTAKNTGVNVGTINVGGATSTADLLAALDWASKVQV